MTWMSVALAVSAAVCGTSSHFSEMSTRPVPATPPAHLAGAKMEHDALGTFPNTVTSTNFAVKWGPNANFTNTEAEQLAAGFEKAWSTLVGDMAYPPPEQSSAYLVNVYVGDTGGDSPSMDDAGGFATWDDQGYPMVAIHPGLVELYALGEPETPDYVAAHEFFHLTQFATLNYETNDRGWWFWESSAEWGAAQVENDAFEVYGNVAAYVGLPHLDIATYDGTSDGELLHQYGKTILWHYVSDELGQPDAILSMWTTTQFTEPLSALDYELQSRLGTSLSDVFPTYAAHTALLDYADGDRLLERVEEYFSYFPDPAGDRRIAATLELAGSTAWIDGPADLTPGPFGYNTITFHATDAATYQVEIRADASAGAQGVLAYRDATHTAHYQNLSEPLHTEAGGTYSLVVSTQPTAASWGAHYPYAYRVTRSGGGGGPKGGGNDGDGDVRAIGCACAVSRPSTPGVFTWIAALGVALAILRRKRSAPH